MKAELHIPESVASSGNVPKVNGPGKKPHLSHSNYWLTINTNRSLSSFQSQPELEAYCGKFIGLVEDLMLRQGILAYVKYKEHAKVPEEKHRQVVNDPADIKYIQPEFSFEVGKPTSEGGNNALHCHCMLRMAHYTVLYLDYKQLRADFVANFGQSVHLFVKRFNNASDNLRKYMKKQT